MVRGFSWHFSKNPIKTSRAIKYLPIGPTQKWCIWKRCSPTRRITPRSPIYGTTKIERIAVETVWKNRVFRMFCDATWRAFGQAHIGDREQKVHIDLHLFCIYRFWVRWVFGFLVAPEIVAFRGSSPVATRPYFPPQLRIWIFIIQKSDLYIQKDPQQRWIPVASNRKTCENRRFLACFPARFDKYLSYRKLENGR